jgi:arylsulfatase A-like enzyme
MMFKIPTPMPSLAQPLCVLSLLLLAGCSELSIDEPAEAQSSNQASVGARANVILVVFDTTRFDDWSGFTGVTSEPVTPVLDALAARAQKFSNARSLYTVSVPSHVSLFTGREIAQPGEALDYRIVSLFGILAEQGYRTLAFSGNKNLSRETIEAMAAVQIAESDLHERMPEEELRTILSNYGEYEGELDGLPGARAKMHARNRRVIKGSAEYVNAAALTAADKFLAFSDAAPYFMFLNYNDAHDPYYPPTQWRQRLPREPVAGFRGNIMDEEQRLAPALTPDGEPILYPHLGTTAAGLSAEAIELARRLHSAELAHADHQFGVLLGELGRRGLLDNTVIIALSDHGEAFGEDGRMGHGGEAIDALVHVPMFMAFPGLESGEIHERVDLRDIKPTLLAYLGIEDRGSTGRNLLPLIRGAVDSLPARDDGEREGTGSSLIRGQDPERSERLSEELKALGYVE